MGKNDVHTSTSDGPLDVGWMPGTDTSDLAKTFVRLAWQLLGAPTSSDTVETVTLGNRDDVDHLVLLEDGADLDWLLEEAVAEVNLGWDLAAVDLDLHKMGLLLLDCVAVSCCCYEATKSMNHSRGVLLIWEWARTRTTVQYFLMRSSSRVIEEALLSACFLAYLVKAFFLLLYQFL